MRSENTLGDRWWIRGPVWLRRFMFWVYPGRWTQAEVDEIYRRARERKDELDRLTD